MQYSNEVDVATNMMKVTVTFDEQESTDIRLYCLEHGLDYQEHADRIVRDALKNVLYA